MAAVLERWLACWDRRDLEGVMALFAPEAVFESWSGVRIAGRERIREAWRGWFASEPGFRFEREDLLIDEEAGEAVFAWLYVGPPLGEAEGERIERRRGIDLIRFRDGLITEKTTYTKTVLERDGGRIFLRPTPRFERS
jgi:ketosteroid isomerase-like protein